ncbi:hypothetical protein TNIN_119861 [Trichonephila inaurata madagascariensis]|uniref:Uncharacterized protein n=1 Tax=Trichonephila inaurata madagascariensis TaxID=2747483 RepID=A0A8X6XZL7_9ARAC|nr:hypothetical protein TNIN_119861 [Trichonephila inaurata madagascariensis]
MGREAVAATASVRGASPTVVCRKPGTERRGALRETRTAQARGLQLWGRSHNKPKGRLLYGLLQKFLEDSFHVRERTVNESLHRARDFVTRTIVRVGRYLSHCSCKGI